MADVYPSQIVEFIDASFPAAWFGDEALQLFDEAGICLSALLTLIDHVPQHLVTLDRSDYSRLVLSRSAISLVLDRARRIDPRTTNQWSLIPRGDGKNPVHTIRELFAKCSDEAPHPKTAGLSFLNDDDLRTSLRSDLDQADRAMRDGHWKSATVLAGAVTEALLLWGIRRDWKTIEPTREKKLQSREPEQWDLADYIAVANNAKIITDETRKQCELCQAFRNLIHPGREKRLGQKATRGRAFGALAAVDLVIECLK